MNAIVSPTVPFTPYRELLQVAYVTPDLDGAIKAMSTGFGISNFMTLADLAVEVGPSQSATLSIALAWVGAVQLELIEPRGGHDQLYRNWLTGAGSVLRFHHVARLVENERDFDRLESELSASGMPVAIRGRNGDQVRYLYTDHVALLGHYVEHIWYAEAARRALFGRIPKN